MTEPIELESLRAEVEALNARLALVTAAPLHRKGHNFPAQQAVMVKAGDDGKMYAGFLGQKDDLFATPLIVSVETGNLVAIPWTTLLAIARERGIDRPPIVGPAEEGILLPSLNAKPGRKLIV